MLKVNTIEFAGRKAVINSYSLQFWKELAGNCEKQAAEWTSRFPNATVRTEDMSDSDVVALVAAGRVAEKAEGSCGAFAHDVGRSSGPDGMQRSLSAASTLALRKAAGL